MAKKRKSRAAAAGTAVTGDAAGRAGRGKKPKGLAAVGFLKSQGTRTFRKRRSAGS
ncbi:MAG TPA: hypothetical protein VGN09_01100 [Vicinamibacteria bacterium]|jgi:nicotinamide mononucleotide (NMN) deamidase PncC